jgi:hypothetical protein
MPIGRTRKNLKKKIIKTADLFKNRHLTHLGKVCLINTLILSKLWHIATVYTPSKFFNVLRDSYSPSSGRIKKRLKGRLYIYQPIKAG